MQQLSAALDALSDDAQREQGEYVVDRVLKEAPGSRTELVHDAAAPSRVLVRKVLDSDAGLGTAFRMVMRAQRQGLATEHLPRIWECGEASGRTCVVMEHVEGETLSELVKHQGVSAELAVRVMPGLCDAVAELHDLPGGPVIHRDIKPSNIMVAPERVVLIDLGIARVYREGAERDTVRFGTPGFAPPEQFGYGQTSRASDIYALGTVLYFCLTGEVPTQEMRERGFRDDRIPEPVARVIAKATSFDPKQRFASAQELRRAIELVFEPDAGQESGAAFRAATKAHASDLPEDAPAVDAPSSESASDRIGLSFEQARKRFINRLGGPLLHLWDGAVFLVWALCVYSAVASIVSPRTADQVLPLWFLVVEYVGSLIVGATLVMFPLVYKPRLRARWPRLARTPWWKELLVCWGAALALAVILTALYSLAVPAGTTVL